MNLIALSNYSNAADGQNLSVLNLSSTAAADLSRYAVLIYFVDRGSRLLASFLTFLSSEILKLC